MGYICSSFASLMSESLKKLTVLLRKKFFKKHPLWDRFVEVCYEPV